MSNPEHGEHWPQPPHTEGLFDPVEESGKLQEYRLAVVKAGADIGVLEERIRELEAENARLKWELERAAGPAGAWTRVPEGEEPEQLFLPGSVPEPE